MVESENIELNITVSDSKIITGSLEPGGRGGGGGGCGKEGLVPAPNFLTTIFFY